MLLITMKQSPLIIIYTCEFSEDPSKIHLFLHVFQLFYKLLRKAPHFTSRTSINF